MPRLVRPTYLVGAIVIAMPVLAVFDGLWRRCPRWLASRPTAILPALRNS